MGLLCTDKFEIMSVLIFVEKEIAALFFIKKSIVDTNIDENYGLRLKCCGEKYKFTC